MIAPDAAEARAGRAPAEGGGPDGAVAGVAGGAVSRSGAFARRASAAAMFTAARLSPLITTTGADRYSCCATPAASWPPDESVRTTVAEDGACVRATTGLRGVPGGGCADVVAGWALEQAAALSVRRHNVARIVPRRCPRV